MGWFSNRRYPAALGAGFLVLWVFSAWGIQDPFDFFLEHILTVLLLTLLMLTRRRFLLSHLSYTLIFGFLLLHLLGAHYTYSLVPYDDWSHALAGFSLTEALGLKRNHYDRLVHFSFGFLMAYPVRVTIPSVRPMATVEPRRLTMSRNVGIS